MVNFDPTPYWRSTVGFDHLFDLLANATLPQAQRPPTRLAPADAIAPRNEVGDPRARLRGSLPTALKEVNRPVVSSEEAAAAEAKEAAPPSKPPPPPLEAFEE